ncbi:cytochrome P450 [Panaeolus papilionaceus]|nr:cytochrome P450 [Panaeolus papilionaceus]
MALSLLSTAFISSLLWFAYTLTRCYIGHSSLAKIRGPPSESFVFGSLKSLFHRKGWDYHRMIAENYPGVAKIHGFLGAKALFVNDPLALHHILVKDQHIYEETDAFIASNRMTFGEGIFTTIGDPHRRQRKLLNPVFSIAHMRNMVLIFYDVSHKLRTTLLKMTKDGPKEVDVMEWMTRTALELIGQSGLGYTFDTLVEGSQPHRYGIASKQLVPLSTESAAISTVLIPYLSKIGTRRFQRFIVDNFPSTIVRKTRDVIDILHNTSVEIFESKKKALRDGDEALAEQIGRGKDIISVLMKANMEAAEEDRLSEEELLGQITSLTFAATDTTSTALARTLHLLSQHKEAQDHLRQELKEAKKGNSGKDLSYDTLVSLPYLDAVCRETLRLYPPVPTIIRTAREDITLPLSTPIKGVDGQMVAEIAVPKNTDMHVSILYSNRNQKIWGADAYEWKPERWLSPLPESVVNARIPGVYSHLLTFIGGGRSCIGFKFSQLEMKVVLALLIDCLEFSEGKKDIIWQMTGIATPNVDPDSTTPTMPLVIDQVN